jgi:hypothetical protein
VSGSRQYPNNDGLDCISCSQLTVANSVFSTGGCFGCPVTRTLLLSRGAPLRVLQESGVFPAPASRGPASVALRRTTWR